MSIDCFCDYDAPVFYSRTMPKARKVHQCFECGGAILPGETYESVSGKWDYVETFKTCARCVDLRTWVKNNLPCVCWGHGNLHDDLSENVREATYRASEETAGLRFGFLRRMVAIEKFNFNRRSVQERASAKSSAATAGEFYAGVSFMAALAWVQAMEDAAKLWLVPWPGGIDDLKL